MGKKNAPPMGIGVVSVFTVLLALTLSVFSALTLSSARADLALSKINADTVSAYYAADSAAVQLYRDFADSLEDELYEQIPMDNGQILSIHLVREGEEIRVLNWQVLPQGGDDLFFEDTLPVWDGELAG